MLVDDVHILIACLIVPGHSYGACQQGFTAQLRIAFLRACLRWQPKGRAAHSHVSFPDGTEPGDTVLEDAEKLAHDKEVILDSVTDAELYNISRPIEALTP